jgi:hypothetical protein
MRRYLTHQVIKYYFNHHCSHHKYEPFPNEYSFEKRLDIPLLERLFILGRWQMVKVWMWFRNCLEAVGGIK